MEITLKYAKMTKSKKTLKMHQKFDFGMEPKITTLLPTYASRSLLSIWFVAVAFLSEDGFLKKGTPRDLFCPPPLDPSLGGSGRNALLPVRGHEHFIPTKFRKHQSSGSVVKADYVFPYIYMH